MSIGVKEVAFIGYPVTDAERSRAFYTGVLGLREADTRTGLARAGVGAAGALLIISPATIHNALGSGEFIPITSHAGIPLAAGNGPGSIGIFTPREDIDGTVKDQALESALAFERATGRRGSWSEIDAYSRNRVALWWREHPIDGAALFARKAADLVILLETRVTAVAAEVDRQNPAWRGERQPVELS